MNAKQIYAVFSLSLFLLVCSLISYKDLILNSFHAGKPLSYTFFFLLIAILSFQSYFTLIALKIWQTSLLSQIVFPSLLILTGAVALALGWRSENANGLIFATPFLIVQCFVLRAGKVKLFARINLNEPKRAGGPGPITKN